MLVSGSDVENYKQIKSDLDDLRSRVEKSELWVYKNYSSDGGGGSKKKKKEGKDGEKGSSEAKESKAKPMVSGNPNC